MSNYRYLTGAKRPKWGGKSQGANEPGANQPGGEQVREWTSQGANRQRDEKARHHSNFHYVNIYYTYIHLFAITQSHYLVLFVVNLLTFLQMFHLANSLHELSVLPVIPNPTMIYNWYIKNLIHSCTYPVWTHKRLSHSTFEAACTAENLIHCVQ